jgi:putative hydrolase
MAEDDPPDPFQGLPFLGDLARLVQSQGPVAWDAARQLAHMIASEGGSEPNVDPVARIQLEQLARVADLHIAAATGRPTSTTGAPIQVVPVTRSQWVARTLDAWRPLFERLATSLGPPATEGEAPGAGIEEFDEDPSAAWLGGLMQMLSPMMLGMAAGSMVGHLAQRSLGQYDLPVPRPPGDELLVVTPTLESFGEEWSLPADDLRLWVCLQEVANHTVLGIPHVRARMEELVGNYVAGFRPDPRSLEDRLGTVDPSAPEGLADV